MKKISFFKKSLLVLLAGSLLACCLVAAYGGPRVSRERGPRSAAVRANNAKRDAAAYIFRYYNRNLSPEKADEYARYVMEASRRYSIEPSLITAIIIKESTAKADARSKYAVGLMQVYWQLHRKTIAGMFPHIKSEKILMEPRNNIMVGTWLFRQYMNNCKGDTTRALKRYLGAKSPQYVAQVNKYRSHYKERVSFNMKASSKRSG